MPRRAKAILAVAATTLSVLSTSASAHAASAPTHSKPTPLSPNAGWIGKCYPQLLSSTVGGGWCDGNGPDWVYQGFVDCTNGWEYYGVVHWAGDRRGSYGYCPSGTTVTSYGVYYWYQ
jgi:hypothetical protein